MTFEPLLIRLFLMMVLLMILAACTGKGIPTITPTPLLPNPIDVQAALLTNSDLPAGWTTVSSGPSHDLGMSSCDAPVPDVKFVAETAVFQHGEHGSRLSETIASFHTGQAQQWLDAFASGPVCNHFDEAGPQGTPVTTGVAQFLPQQTGDQSFGYEMSTSFGGSTYETDVIYVRVGDNIVQLGESSLGNLDRGLLNSLEREALDKLQTTPF